VPNLHGISRKHYAMHATQLFLTSQGYPMLMSIVPHAWEKKLKKRLCIIHVICISIVKVLCCTSG